MAFQAHQKDNLYHYMKSTKHYLAPDIEWEMLTAATVLCESGEVPDYEPIDATDIVW